ncbi:LuxR family transcriptional regulator [Burkholderia sp. PU8-34]
MTSNWSMCYGNMFSDLNSESELIERMTCVTRELGFEHFYYVMRIPLPISNPRNYIFSNCPDTWIRSYVERDGFRTDPAVQRGLRETVPFLWSAVSGEPADFWVDPSQQRFRHAWSMPSRGQFGTIGLLSLLRKSAPILQGELLSKEPYVLWLTTLAHRAMTRLVVATAMPEVCQTLTAREKEVLKWTAAGKTYADIGLILSIYDRTVKFHLMNVMRKLRAANKAEAVMKATMLGFLQ